MIEINVGANNLSTLRNPLNIISREEKKNSKNSVNFVTFFTFWLCKIPNKRSFAVLKK